MQASLIMMWNFYRQSKTSAKLQEVTNCFTLSAKCIINTGAKFQPLQS